ncbi:MAG: glycerol-3-phosphate dehydrogenase [Crocinitomicaceae bacterium]|nr:glycerol-3-phosphate dehydrogenase [Crocinitomicaceae bacterium]|tara:strand:+ start:395 stop:2005 length:1611 start_codon:yes stop_codon:yes gene_type:complete
MISINERSEFLKVEINQLYDLIIIGGGITGAGILLDASSRGLKTLLIEKNDYASGTSSKSTKLIHGGLRYLNNLEFKMVSNVGRERMISHNNAPHLVIPEKMLIPITKNGAFKKWQLSIALFIYDFLARVKRHDKRKILSKEETLNVEPELKSSNLKGAGYYAEYRTDDARLTIEIIKTAEKFKGKSINYLEAKSIEKKNYFSLDCHDHIHNKSIKIKAKKVVNACGPWVDLTRAKENKNIKSKIRLSKGVHIVVGHNKLPLKQSVYFDTKNKRMCFAIPRENVTYIGTTDNDYNNHPDNPKTSIHDVEYLIKSTNENFKSNLLKSDVISSWVGLRPLIEQKGKKSTELSRKDEIFISKSGMISIAGGKLTGYRLMAKKVVDIIAKDFNNQKCLTENISISGSFKPEFQNYHLFKKEVKSQLLRKKINTNISDYLIQNYGINCLEIIENYNPKSDDSIKNQEIIYTLKNEGVCKPIDYFIRRSGNMFFHPLEISDDIFKFSKTFEQYLNLEKSELYKLLQDVLDEKKRITTFNDKD